MIKSTEKKTPKKGYLALAACTLVGVLSSSHAAEKAATDKKTEEGFVTHFMNANGCFQAVMNQNSDPNNSSTVTFDVAPEIESKIFKLYKTSVTFQSRKHFGKEKKCADRIIVSADVNASAYYP